MKPSRLSSICLFLGILGSPSKTPAHPMGNFSINHYARFEARADGLHIRYILDLAEIPTVTERTAMDADRNGTITPGERDSYLHRQGLVYRNGLSLSVDGNVVVPSIKHSSLTFLPGAAGLDTLRIVMDMAAPLPHGGQDARVEYTDTNFPNRTGWKEILTRSGSGFVFLRSTAGTADRSQELTHYPTDPSIVPPAQTRARFTISNGLSAPATEVVPEPVAGGARSSTPRDAFTEAISRKHLSAGFIIVSLLLAFVFGSFHALSPGHGKTMVAAYLVGSRGTLRHAALLGLVVTITHTAGVFALGVVTLFASRYLVPERLYPILSAVSGLAIAGVGLCLFYTRVRSLLDGSPHGHEHHHDHDHQHEHHHDHDHDHHHDHEHPHSHGDPAPAHTHGPVNGLFQDHRHDHSHDHDHHHDYSHDHHSHDNHGHHHHIPEGPITVRSLVALGISGGIVPCPSALVVLLSAVALHRVLYGMVLITAFSVGLASVLIAIGMMVVVAGARLNRINFGGPLIRAVPIVGAGVMTIVGFAMLLSALHATGAY